MSIGSTVECPTAVPARRGVPWATVLPVAVVMAFANGFWLTSLRGAVGAIERTQGPFASWLRESTLAVPAYVFAVLAALTLALRLFGSAPRRLRLVTTALMVVAAGTVAGTALMAASSAYDYHLQASQQQMMHAMGGTCAIANCLTAAQQASFGLAVRAVVYGSAILLVTNLAVVAWVYAIRGGRLDVASRRRRAVPDSAAGPDSAAVPDSTRVNQVSELRRLLAAALIGSALLHAAVVPEHQREWPAAGAFFMVLAAAQLWLAVAVRLSARLQPAVLPTVAALCAGTLAVWVYSRSLGMPFGPGAGIPEPVGVADVGASLLELAALFIALVLLRDRGWLRHPPASAHLRWLALVAVVAVTSGALAGSGLPVFDDITGSTGDSSIVSAH
ncbi:hypothetical protein [Lapillicoccus sp.]|uniref:hypothetical protein n=1 Tax=Lapillicoccus sp. TaxID=1909287 RepID=UPI003983AA3F